MAAETRLELTHGLQGRALPALRRKSFTAAVRRPAGRPRWQTLHARLVVLSDLVALTVSAALYWLTGTATTTDFVLYATAIPLLTVVCLMAARAWDPSTLGQGSGEFARMLNGLVMAGVVLALVSLALKLPQARPWVFGFLPVAGIFAALGRLALRLRLHRHRRTGRSMLDILAVGTEESVGSLIARTRRAPHYGMRVVAVCTPSGTGTGGASTIDGVPVTGDLDSVADQVSVHDIDAVSVGQTPGWSPARLQQLAWDLEGTATGLVVDPGLMEIAGPRLHVSSVDGMPLLRLTHPRFSGAAWLLKNIVDRSASALLLLVVAPLMIAIAIAIRIEGGKAFFRQTRVGIDGREFSMIKFRSMHLDAESRLSDLVTHNEGQGVLFKMRDDPRITTVGGYLRKYSLDELPQLLNVLGGSMSMVGPRPPLPREVARYERNARRRLLVKPGITGLWQVSGRSDLSWEESVRLDLRYVENWSLALDAQILVKTVRAVVGGSGAY